MDLAVLLDAPAVAEGQATSLHPVARLGRYSDPRYGKFAITRADVASWQANLRGIQRGRIPIDYDHAADAADGSTKAAGWITGLELMTGAQLAAAAPDYQAEVEPSAEYAVATIDWTPEGAASVRDGYWLYVSPTFVDRYRDEEGKSRGPALIGTALTNRPFLRRGMPAIALTAAGLDDLPAAVADEDDPSRDSRRTMPDLTKLTAALGLDENADEDALVAAVEQLKADADKPALEPGTTLSLSEAAAKEGKVLLTQAEVDGFKLAAEKAESQTRELRFTAEYDKALRAGKLDSSPETRERYSKLFERDEDLCLELLEHQPQVVTLTTTGDGGADAGDAPAGVDPDRHALHTRALAIQAEKDVTYLKAAELAEKELSRAA